MLMVSSVDGGDLIWNEAERTEGLWGGREVIMELK